MTQASRPQAENNSTPAYVDAGPYSRNQWAERMRAAHTGDANTASSRSRIRGVVPSYDNMLVTTISGTDAEVGTGAGMVYGSYLFNDALVTFSPPAAAANSHIDLVCMVENNTNAAVATDSSGNTWTFPTVVADYAAGPAVPPYSARLVIISGTDNVAPAEPVLDQLSTLYCVPLAEYEIDTVPAITNLVDRREFLDIEQIVGVATAEDDTIEEALIIGTQVTDGTGDDGLGVAIRARLENDNGDLEDAGQIAVRWTDSTNGSEDARYELRLAAGNADNLSAVINAPTAASADGNARGVGAVDLQQVRAGAAQVSSGAGSFLCGQENTASGAVAYAEGYQNTASGNYAHAEGNVTTATQTATHAEGYNNDATANYAHAEGSGTTASGASSHSEGATTTASGVAAHAEGSTTTASGDYSHTEGFSTAAAADYGHAEGNATSSGGLGAHAEGGNNDADGDYSHAEGSFTTAAGDYAHSGGLRSYANEHAQMARAGSRFAVDGDGQYSIYPLLRSVTHSDANWYSLYLDGAAAIINVAADQVMTFDALIVGTTQGCTKSFSYRIVGIIENDGGTTSLLASTVTTIFEDDADFNARASADDPNDALLIELTDSTSGGDTVRWSAVVRTAEVMFPA